MRFSAKASRVSLLAGIHEAERGRTWELGHELLVVRAVRGIRVCVDHGLRRPPSEDDQILGEQPSCSEGGAEDGVPLHRDDVAQRHRGFVQPAAAKLVYGSERGESAEDDRQSGPAHNDAARRPAHEPERTRNEAWRRCNSGQRVGQTAPRLTELDDER